MLAGRGAKRNGEGGTQRQLTMHARSRAARAVALLVVCSLVLCGCGLLQRGGPQPALLPTRTLPPPREVTDVPTTTPAAPTATQAELVADTPVATDGASARPTAQAAATPRPTHEPTLAACSRTKLDLVATALQPAKSAGQIAFDAMDGNLALTDPAGHVTAVTGDANLDDANGALLTYNFPAFSDDGKSLAFIGFNTVSGTDTITQTLFAAPAKGKARLTTLYSTSADNIPYMDWSPDGQWLAFMTVNDDGGTLQVVAPDGGKPAEVGKADYVYMDWRRDAAALALHFGSSGSDGPRVAVVDAQSRKTALFDDVPGAFMAPQFSPDGKYILLVTAENGSDKEDLVLADATGKSLCAIAPLLDGAAFAWSPDGRRVAWIDTVSTRNAPGPLYVQEVATGRQQQYSATALGFFWSPDGTRLASYSVEFNGTPTDVGRAGSALDMPAAQQPSGALLRIEVADVNTGRRVRVADTVPSRTFLQVLAFIDQYSRAISPWSPDGQKLVFTTAIEAEQTVAVVVATLGDLSAPVQFKRVGEGTLAVWSPR
jgi:Tol biopolymer transport system component